MARAFSLVIAALLPVCVTLGHAQEKTKDHSLPLTIKPVVLDGSNSTGATVGIEWRIEGRIVENELSRDKTGKDTFDDVAEARSLFDVNYRLSGTFAANKDRNPKNFQDALIDAVFLYYSPAGAVSAGVFGKYEADQGLDNRQAVYGLRATGGRRGLAHPKRRDYISLDVNFGEVDPSKDNARQAALGAMSLDRYYRWDLEFLYQYPIASRGIETFEYNYRYYRETDPPFLVAQAGLARHKLSTVRLGLKNDLFIAYSTGKLPFDRQSDRIYEIGWSHSFK